jgi:nitrate/TMAO reductase-like tetraheme cytochrome c subunit
MLAAFITFLKMPKQQLETAVALLLEFITRPVFADTFQSGSRKTNAESFSIFNLAGCGAYGGGSRVRIRGC